MSATFTRPAVETMPTGTAPAVQGLTLPETATVKQARRLAVRMGVADKEPGLVSRAVSWVKDKVRGFRVEEGKRA